MVVIIFHFTCTRWKYVWFILAFLWYDNYFSLVTIMHVLVTAVPLHGVICSNAPSLILCDSFDSVLLQKLSLTCHWKSQCMFIYQYGPFFFFVCCSSMALSWHMYILFFMFLKASNKCYYYLISVVIIT